jgi:large subunit ribosomal protein L24e
MPKCSFCSSTLEPGTGVMLVRNDGKVFYFCSKKCERNMIRLRREPKDVRWITKKTKKI